jgi:hypothetical protein
MDFTYGLHVFIGIFDQAWASGLVSPYAYLDPGSGSYLLQLLIASALGGLVVLRMYWSRVTAFFRRIFGKTPPDDDA